MEQELVELDSEEVLCQTRVHQSIRHMHATKLEDEMNEAEEATEAGEQVEDPLVQNDLAEVLGLRVEAEDELKGHGAEGKGDRVVGRH